MLYLYLVLLNSVLGEWYTPLLPFCARGWLDVITNEGGDNLNAQIYHCEREEIMMKSTVLTSQSSCTSYTDCYLDTDVIYEEVCMGRDCVWDDGCYCREIDAWSDNDGCDACRTPTASPVYENQCDCSNSLGFGLYDSNDDCQCDVELLSGDDCYGGTGNASFDVGTIPFVEESCNWDSSMGLWRKIKCYTLTKLDIEFFSDDECSVLLEKHRVVNDTCYYYPSFVLESMEPTQAPTAAPVISESPTRAPTMTDAPTLSPIVVDTKTICNQTDLYLTLNQTFYDFGDQQWIEDCLTLLETRTQQFPILCGCLGKFPGWMANTYLNCILQEPYHGLTIWNMCKGSRYTQSCGSKCTRRRLTQYEVNQRRRSQTYSTFKLTWSDDVCDGRFTSPDATKEPTVSPSRPPTALPSKEPTLPPPCSDGLGLIRTSDDCMCGNAYCYAGEVCIASNNECYRYPKCLHTDGEMLQISTCVCGISGVTCDIDILNAFLCIEIAAAPCRKVELCPNTDGTEENPNWCICESQVSDESWGCANNQYCDALHGQCSSHPTCEDTSGSKPSIKECRCGSSLTTCVMGEYCKVTEWNSACSASASVSTSKPSLPPSEYPTYTPSVSPSLSPTNVPTDMPTHEPTLSPTLVPTESPLPSPTPAPSTLPTAKPTEIPTQLPTTPSSTFCTDYVYWSKETEETRCSNIWEGTNKPNRGFGSMVACDSAYQLRLEESQANGLFGACNRWCTYDFQSVKANEWGGFIWKKPPKQCWHFVNKYTCFSGHALNDFNNQVIKVATICPGTIPPIASPSVHPTFPPSHYPTLAPTQLPTTPSTTLCTDYVYWSKETADALCSNIWEGTNKPNRGYGSMVACDSAYQLRLEESQANGLFGACTNWCTYDFQSVQANEWGGYIWKKPPQQCWHFVDKWTCFSGNALNDFNNQVIKMTTICAGTIPPHHEPADMIVYEVIWVLGICCLDESQIAETIPPVAESLSLDVSSVRIAFYTEFDSSRRRDSEVTAKKLRRLSSVRDGAWDVEYQLQVAGMNNALNMEAQLNDATFVDQIGGSIRTSMNIALDFIFTREVFVNDKH